MPSSPISSRKSPPSSVRYGKTKQERVYHELRKAILEGRFPAGSYLPTVRELGKEFHVSITPVYQAIGSLEQEGLLCKFPGYGFQIAENHAWKEQQELSEHVRPVVEVVTTLREIGTRPVFGHRLPAVQEALILGLRKDPGLRLSLVNLQGGAQTFDDLLKEAGGLSPTVFTFSEPEALSFSQVNALESLRRNGVHVVYRATFVDHPLFDRVMSDFDQGQHDLTAFLLDSGHREILRVGIQNGSVYEEQKEKGFQKALRLDGVPGEAASTATDWLDPEFLNLSAASKVTLFAGLLAVELSKRPITAVMAPDDNAVAPFRIALRKLGRQDIVVTGYDNIWSDLEMRLRQLHGEELTDWSPPPTVDTCLLTVGETMAELVIERAYDRMNKAPICRHVPQTLVLPT